MRASILDSVLLTSLGSLARPRWEDGSMGWAFSARDSLGGRAGSTWEGALVSLIVWVEWLVVTVRVDEEVCRYSGRVKGSRSRSCLWGSRVRSNDLADGPYRRSDRGLR